jgi:SAM-dependent methyltransferase
LIDDDSYKLVNQRGWEYLARQGCEAAQPWALQQLEHARERLDAMAWIPWDEVKSVLCLAAGGGQQAPLLAALGCRVTSADLCAVQLDRDREVAERHGLEIECIEADMLDLSPLHGRDFDLVYQAVSACYVPDVRRLYREVARVVRPNGYYRVEHWNSVQIQLANEETWREEGYRIVRPQAPGQPVPWRGPGANGSESPAICWHYVHPLHDLIGGLGDAGFEILRFGETYRGDASAEPGSQDHLAAYLPPFFTLLARRTPVPRC